MKTWETDPFEIYPLDIEVDIEIDIEECVPTTRIPPQEYRAKVEEQEYAHFWRHSSWRDEPITQRCKPR